MRKSFIFFLSVLLLLFQSIEVSAVSAGRTQLNFDDVEVLSIIKLMSKITGRTFIFNAKELKGKKITLLSKQKFNPKEAYQIFEAVLQINGLSTIDEGAVTRIIPTKKAKIEVTPNYSEKSSIHGGAYITRIIPVKNVNIRTLRTALQPLVSKDSVLVSVDEANILILRDTKENIERFMSIVELVDQVGTDESSSIQLELYPLQNANAHELSALVDKIFNPGKKNAADENRFRIFDDKRTNNLILVGKSNSLDKIKSLLSKLDLPISADEGNVRVFQLKNANAKKVSVTLQSVTKSFASGRTKTPGKQAINISIIPDTATNSLVIFADPSDFPAIENVLNKLDTARPQVFIQALIMEMKLDKSLDLGIEWQAGKLQNVPNSTQKALVTGGGVGSSGGPKSFPATSSGGEAIIGIVGGPITFGGQSFSSFNAFIKATQNDQEIDILSNPQLLTLNNEEAEIKVGEIIPTVGSTKVDTTGNVTTSIDYKEVGISLKITPQVNSDKTIELKIDQTSSNVISGKLGAFNQGAITTLNRAIKSTVVVDDGKTIVLGGLISDEISNIEISTPCLGAIPILGWLFKTQSSTVRKTNLLIFLTPIVVRNAKELQDVSHKVQLKLENAKEGRFRIDVTKEFRIDDDDDVQEDSDEISETQEEKQPQVMQVDSALEKDEGNKNEPSTLEVKAAKLEENPQANSDDTKIEEQKEKIMDLEQEQPQMISVEPVTAEPKEKKISSSELKAEIPELIQKKQTTSLKPGVEEKKELEIKFPEKPQKIPSK